MPTLIGDKPKGRFVSILADGKLHETVPAGTEDAVEREYETSDGKKGKKWERVYAELRGTVKKVEFWKGEYGDMIQLTFADKTGEEQITLSQGIKGNFGEDILRKLPNLIPGKELWLKPYAFDDENGKPKRGVTFYQNGDKLTDFFRDEKGNKLHGYPEPDGDSTTYDSDDWAMYFTKARKFTVEYAKEHVLPKFDGEIEYEPEEIKYPDEDLGEQPF